MKQCLYDQIKQSWQQYPADDVDEHQLERDLCRESLIVNGSPVTAHQDLVDLAVLRRQVSDNVFVARTVGVTTADWRRAAIERMLQACDRTVAGGDTYTEVLGLLAEHATKFVATPSGSSAPASGEASRTRPRSLHLSRSLPALDRHRMIRWSRCYPPRMPS